MTTCGGQLAEAVAEQYVRGELPEAEAQSFEEHYLECDVCFEHVRAVQAVSQTLSEKHASITFRPPAWAAFAFAAAAVLTISLTIQWNLGKKPVRQDAALQTPVLQKTAPPASPDSTQEKASETVNPKKPLLIASLADKSLPPFRAVEVRGASDNEHFDTGMRAYAAGDCVTAINELKRVPRNSDRAEATALYIGACEYERNHFEAAVQTLQEVAKNQDSPFSEAARYYLAQVELLKNDSAGARHWLGEVIALHGDYEKRARAQLRQIQ